MWSLFVHRSYALAIYHYIPYEIIKERIDSIRGNGRIFIYGRTSESEYYLSETQALLLDETVDLSTIKTPEFVRRDSAERQTQARRISPTREALIDRDDIVTGNVIVVHGMHMRGGSQQFAFVNLIITVHISMTSLTFNNFTINTS